MLFREKFSQKKRMKHNGEASSGLVGVQRSTSFLFSPTFYSSVMSSSIGRHKQGLQRASVMGNWKKNGCSRNFIHFIIFPPINHRPPPEGLL